LENNVITVITWSDVTSGMVDLNKGQLEWSASFTGKHGQAKRIGSIQSETDRS